MSTFNDDDTFYARWLNNQLTENEKKHMAAKGDDKVLSKIVNTIDGWSLPEMSVNHQEKLKAKLQSKKQAKLIPFYRKSWFYAAACILVLVVSIVYLRKTEEPTTVLYSCDAGKTKTITLPDASTVQLFGKSHITLDDKNFATTRELNLKGSALFKVTKKGSFVVNHEYGSVKVLGTVFSVQSINNASTVRCFEGKVQVENPAEKIILVPGKGVSYHSTQNMKSFEFDATKKTPSSNKEMIFENASLEEVCNSLSIGYDIDFKGNDIDFSRNYSGKFALTNIDTALRMVFEPMQIRFTIKGKTVYLENK